VGSSVPALQLRVALVVIAWAISEPLLLGGGASPLLALGFGLLVTVPLLFCRRWPVLVAIVIALAYLTQYATGERMEDAMSPELALAFGLFGMAAYASGSRARLASVAALAVAAAIPGALWVISELNLGEVEAVAPTQYLYLTAVVFAGVLPGLALRTRQDEVDRLDVEIQELVVRAANEVGATVDDERRTLSRELVRVVEGLVDEVRPLVVEARRELSGIGPAAAGLGRRMAEAAGRAADELRALLHTLTGDAAAPPNSPRHGARSLGDAKAASSTPRHRGPRALIAAAGAGLRALAADRGLDLRNLAGLAFPVAGLAALCVVDRIELPALPLTAVTASGEELTIPASEVSPAIGYALAALTPAGLLLRRRAPVLAIAIVAAFLFLRVEVDEISSLMISQVFVCGALAYNAGAWARSRGAALAGLAIALGITGFCWYSEQYHFDWLVYAYMVAVLLGTWLVGRAIRGDLRAALALRNRAAALRAQRDRLCRAAIHGQRRDVARELHDVVGHGLSLIVVQAGVVDALAERDRDRARAALEVVDEATHTTQAELAALRTALDDGPAASGPSGSCTRTLNRIVDEARGAGQPLLAYVDPRVDDLPADARTAIVRIAQEALTNARKHAAGAATTLEVELRGDHARLTVHNEAGAPLPDAPRGSGLGLRGMAERAEAQGGTLAAGPEDDGWTVRAELPRAGVTAGSPTPLP
jgi:signal transduction histidine kinase